MTLAEYLKRKKLTQAAFADECEVNVATISRFFTGSRLPSVENTGKILGATDGKVSLDEFIAEFKQYEKAEARP